MDKKSEIEPNEKNAPKAPKQKGKNKKRSKSGLIFWMVFAIIIAVCFIIARGRIANVLRETDFINEVLGTESNRITDLVNSQAEHEEKQQQKKAEKGEKAKKLPKINKSKSEKTASKDKEKKKPAAEETIPQEIQRNESELKERVEIANKANKEQSKKAPAENKASENLEQNKTVEDKAKETEQAKPNQAAPETMHINLCFVQIDDSDGSIIRRETIRTVEKNTSPLTTAINALITGPNSSEAQKGLISIIPPESRLISARITNKTAILNFNEEFTYNSYGVQGQITQLMQIVYTATSFSTIDNVQFLIEGQKIDYLGGEGVWIGSPLSRFSFK